MAEKFRVRVRVRGGVLVRRETERVPLFQVQQPTGKWREWAWNEQVSIARGERMTAAGKAERIVRRVDGFVQVVGYKMTRPARIHRCTPATLTEGTMQDVADAVRSDDRAHRRSEVIKFRVWQDVPETFRDAQGNFVPGGVYKSPTIRPRVSEEEHKRAFALLRIKIQEPKPADVVAMPIAVMAAAKPLMVRSAADALAAAGPRLGVRGAVRAVAVA